MSVEDMGGKRDGMPTGQGIVNWFDPRRRGVGMWAFVLNRLSGLGLAVYLILHLAVLSTLARGEANWEAFLVLARSPVLLLLDSALFAALLYHGLNGIRVALVGMGFGVERHKVSFGVVMGLAAAALVYAVMRLWTA
ncbi:MAG TPA: succinate dehydrogenase, cytochrome b556 subunit [Chloroflexota bacterium]|nr:succinate dehydrogenase, cytochrome b556 subunit [Chloroflexota bacterium]